MASAKKGGKGKGKKKGKEKGKGKGGGKSSGSGSRGDCPEVREAIECSVEVSRRIQPSTKNRGDCSVLVVKIDFKWPPKCEGEGDSPPLEEAEIHFSGDPIWPDDPK